jgi:hypothetical protein
LEIEDFAVSSKWWAEVFWPQWKYRRYGCVLTGICAKVAIMAFF